MIFLFLKVVSVVFSIVVCRFSLLLFGRPLFFPYFNVLRMCEGPVLVLCGYVFSSVLNSV